MRTVSMAQRALQKEAGFFNQIAMFSVAGLAMSMMLVVECGLRVLPWF